METPTVGAGVERRRPFWGVLGLLLVLALPGGAFALVSMLPQPPKAEQIASEALAETVEPYLVRSIEYLPGRTVRASCRTLSARRSLLSFSNGVLADLVTKPTKRFIVPLRPRALSPTLRRFLRDEVALADCPNFVSSLLSRRLDISIWKRGPAFLHLQAYGHDAYAVEFRPRHPELDLILRRGTLEPVGILLRAGRLRASSRLISVVLRSPRRRPA
jgi:hypothetical protein